MVELDAEIVERTIRSDGNGEVPSVTDRFDDLFIEGFQRGIVLKKISTDLTDKLWCDRFRRRIIRRHPIWNWKKCPLW